MKALILMWNGKEVSNYLVEKVVELLTTNGICIPENLTAKYKDEEGVAKALVRDCVDLKVATSEPDSPIVNAVIYIGERFANEIVGKGSSPFFIELARAAVHGDEPQLNTAIEIIATHSGVIPSSLVKKYHFNKEIIHAIKQAYALL